MATYKTQYTISLNHSEALLFYEWLASLDESGNIKLDPDSVEQTILWRIEGQLESALPDVVAADYTDRLSAARLDIRSQK